MESEITREEFIELIAVTSGSIDSQFELWLTVTFAVIIASYLAGHKLSPGLQHLIAILYTFVSILLFMLLWQAVFLMDFMLGDLASWGPYRIVVAALRVIVWVIGSVATLIFIYKGHKDPDENVVEFMALAHAELESRRNA